MPHPGMISNHADKRKDEAVAHGDTTARELVNHFGGPGVGLIDRTAAAEGVHGVRTVLAESTDRLASWSR
jgi:hypothetical protein